MSGNQLGVSYNHLGGTAETLEYSFGGVVTRKINYSVDGLLNYNIFVEDTGTYFSEYVEYSGTYRCD